MGSGLRHGECLGEEMVTVHLALHGLVVDVGRHGRVAKAEEGSQEAVGCTDARRDWVEHRRKQNCHKDAPRQGPWDGCGCRSDFGGRRHGQHLPKLLQQHGAQAGADEDPGKAGAARVVEQLWRDRELQQAAEDGPAAVGSMLARFPKERQKNDDGHGRNLPAEDGAR